MITLTLLFTIVLTTFTNTNIESIKTTSRLLLTSLIYTIVLNLMDYNIIMGDQMYYIYNGLLMINSTNYIMTLLMLIVTIYYISIMANNITSIKYYDNLIYNNKLLIIIIAFNTLGLMLLTQINDLMLLFMIIETQSYSLYMMTSLFNKSINTLKAGLFYFMVGSIGSLLMLDSTMSMYDETGLTNIQYIMTLFYPNTFSGLEYNQLLGAPWLFIIIGIFIKTGLAPFFNYSIVIYTLAPTIITYYISLLPKLSLLTIMNMFMYFLNSPNYIEYVNYINILIVTSLFIGSIGGTNVIKIKTLLAYSSLLNMTYMIMTIINNYNNYYPMLTYFYYIAQYSMMHLLMFNIMLIMPVYTSINILPNSTNNSHANNIILSKYSPIEFISQFTNLINSKGIFLAISLTMALFSLIGIPPIIGFYGKTLITINTTNNSNMTFAMLIVIVSSMSMFYYSNMIKTIWFNTNSNTNNNIYSNNTNISNKVELLQLNNITYIMSMTTLMSMFSFMEYNNMTRGLYMMLYN
uniref:NADH-ubiquinone oxidoreductase chain 2 n=1 Tax=Ogataea parapolymorpha (strain ATCC 26012 / BCRC 20466 / JCM 22074 / NRRL Y-7560 / DL-1) TaxID=871575 RepID=E7E835_OGAPD|nr:NADH dehydrogenase subunit 2 [Ogataea polymorpha]ADT63566.1 NADH dehydrogenase subunit 2 [Ogataea polymorpha]